MPNVSELSLKFTSVWPFLDERSRRMMAAAEAKSIGYGGVSIVHRASGLSRKAISKGMREIESGVLLASGRLRRTGGGRKPLTVRDPTILETLEHLVDQESRGDPQSPLQWTCKSTRNIADELTQMKHPASHTKVAVMLDSLGYSLQGNRKTLEGSDHPDRDEQFQHINAQVKKCLQGGLPVISVDTKKKELIGNYDNPGQQWRPLGRPLKVQGHDFPSPDIPRAYPYGIYDLARNAGFVNVGTDHDTAAFAVASIGGWWKFEGKRLYPKATKILITADGGGSNGWRLRLWKLELQKFADQTGMEISVCHFPPGTSKWNKVEHRLFSFISSNWRGQPLRDYQTIVKLIANTTTAKGLKVICRLDHHKYPIGQKISQAEIESINLKRNSFHGEWNYLIKPHKII